MILVLIVVEMGFMPAQEVFAATLTVTNTNDSGPGSLRQAIADAGTGDVITVDPSLAGGTIALTSQLYIDKNLAIDGSGLNPQLILSGGHSTRILEIVSPAQVTLSHLWFTDGQSTNGGAINNTGNLTIDNSTFSNNSSSGGGGAIAGAGVLITDSTFMNNSASDGGAIYSTFGWLEIYRSTMVHNQATTGLGGAIRLAGNGEAVIVNSTITENSVADEGGAISIGGVNLIFIVNSTFARNMAVSGTEIDITGTSSDLQIINSVFVCVSDGGSCYQSPTAPGMTNSILGPGTFYDYGLAELADNGGPTQTMALLPGSPLIDAGTFTQCPATDQRGITRPKGSHCDIGAYEDQAIVRYVKQGAGGKNDGTSWANAYTELQSALAATFPDEEIWVAAGTYMPTATTDRSISFNLHNGVALYGGFAGGETSLAQRDPAAHSTVLSGNIDNTGENSDNSYHVVVGSGTNNSAILDGFTVTGGHANGTSPNDKGGGMYNHQGSPSIGNVTFENNSATFDGGMYNGGDSGASGIGSFPVLRNVVFHENTADEGGGMENQFYSSPTLSNVTFTGNTAARSGGGMLNYQQSSPSLTDVTFIGNTASAGGGMANWVNSNPTLERVTFSGNSAENGGGMANDGSSPGLHILIFDNNSVTIYGAGMSNDVQSNPTLVNVTFSNNKAYDALADTYGGGMTNVQSSPTLSNVTFYGNSATHGGGLLNRDGDSAPILTNVTFSGNTAAVEGGAIADDSNMVVRNGIFWGNSGGEISTLGLNGHPSVTYSIVQGGFTGAGNLNLNPLLGPLANNGGVSKRMG